MSISTFDDLLVAARAQPLPQRLLFVFVRTSLQKDYNAEERAGFERGVGGALQPLFCADLATAELSDFSALVENADRLGEAWDKVLIAGMDDTEGAAQRAETELRVIIARIESGADLRGYACFDRDGDPIQFF